MTLARVMDLAGVPDDEGVREALIWGMTGWPCFWTTPEAARHFWYQCWTASRLLRSGRPFDSMDFYCYGSRIFAPGWERPSVVLF